MRKLMFLSFMFLSLKVYAAVPVAEAPVNGYGTPVTIAVSSTTLTKVPTTQTSGRMGFYINNPSTNAVAGHLGNCTSTTLASTIRPIQFALVTVGTGPGLYYISAREDVCFWAIALETGVASQNIHVQELKQ